MPVNQSSFWRALEARLAQTADPRHRTNLATVIAHSKAEVGGDIDGVLATLTAEPSYAIWADGRDIGPKGRDGVVAFYTALMSTGSFDIEAPIERLVVDDDTIVTEMAVRQAMPGPIARANGYQVDDDSAFYLIEFRTVVLWRFLSDGKLAGEDAYSSRNLADIRKLEDTEVPENLRRLIETNTGNPDYVFFG